MDTAGIRDNGWWQQTWDTIQAPFRSWDSFAEFCGKVGMVAGIVAMFASGPLGWAVMITAVAANTVVLAHDLSRYGKGGVGADALALDVLGVIPFSPGAVARGAVALLEGGRAVVREGGGRALVSWLGRGIAGQARQAWSAVQDTAAGAVEAVRGWRSAAPVVAGRAKAAGSWLKKCLTSDPVDIATGEVTLQQVDLTLPGILDFALVRTHISSYRSGRHYGPGWASTLDQRLEFGPDGICFPAEDGAVYTFALPMAGASVLADEGAAWQLTRHRARTRDGDGGERFTLRSPDLRHTLHFAAHPADRVPGQARPDGSPVVLPMTAVTDRNGNQPEWQLRSDATLILVSYVEESTAFEQLVKMLDDSDTAVIEAAVRSLVTGGGQLGLARVLKVLADSEDDVGYHIRDVLVDLWFKGNQIVERCRNLLVVDVDDATRDGATEIISTLVGRVQE